MTFIFVSNSAPITANAATSKVVGVGKTFAIKKLKKSAKVSGLSKAEKKIVKVTINKKKRTATVKGLKAGKATFKIGKKAYTVKVGATKFAKKTLKTTMTAGTTQTVSVTATGGKGDTIKFASSNKAVLKVNKTSAKASAKGIAKMDVAAVAEGTAKLTVSSKYTGVKKSFTIKVTAAQPAPTQAPTVVSTPGITTPTATVAATNAPSAVTTPGVTAPGTTDAAGATNVPGTTDNASSEAPTATDAVASPEATTEPTVAPTFDPATATQGAITVNANVTGASIKVKSGDKIIYTATMKDTNTSLETSTLEPGVYTVEVTKKGYDKVTKTVTVNGNVTIDVTMVESIQTGLSFKVENSLSEYANTVLVNDQAIVTANLKDEKGNPLANKTVVLSTSVYEHSDDVADNSPKCNYVIKGNDVVTTDENGNASFVVGLKESTGEIKVTDTDYIATVNIKAAVAGDSSVTQTGFVRFAAISVNNLKNLNGVADTDYEEKKLLAGTNAQDANSDLDNPKDGSEKTNDINGTATTYIYSQQVSSKDGTSSHAVYFSASPEIILCGTNVSTDEGSTYFTQPANIKSDAYHTYASASQKLKVEEDMSALLYATVNFDSVQLSPYTYLDVSFYTDGDCTKEFNEGHADVQIGDVTGTGEVTEQKKFGVQIPKTADASGKYVKGVKFTLCSAGQVETDKNAGYSITDISGVYKSSSSATTAGGSSALTSAEITWKAITPLMSDTKELGNANAAALGITDASATNSDGSYTYSYTYQVPVFPYTGDAVITEKDGNGKIVAYYLAPTENKKVAGEFTNENVIRTNGKKAYKATKDEVTNYITTGVSQTGNIVTVDSTEAGSTTLMGSLNIKDDSIASSITNDATTTIYTSVQWNPIPNGATDEEDGSVYPFFAIAGQSITVKAQLVDQNGNAVNLPDQGVIFEENNKPIESATVVSGGEAKTDTNGVATLVLNRATAGDLKQLTAKAADATKYNVVMLIGDKKISEKSVAELHWVDANLQFLKHVGEASTDDNTTKGNTINVNVAEPKLGNPWEYAVRTVAGKILDAKTDSTILADRTVEIEGLKINTSFDEENKGTYKVIGNGVVSAEAGVENKDTIITKLDETSVGETVTFKVTDAHDVVHEYVSVGEGTPNLSAKLNLGVDWKISGKAATMIMPNGTSILNSVAKNSPTGSLTDIYVQVTDELGNNPAKGAEVTLEVSAVKGNEKAITKKYTAVNTDQNGIAKFTVNDLYKYNGYIDGYNGGSTYDATSSIVTAKVTGTDIVVSKTINWVNPSELDTFNALKAQKSGDKEVTVTFNNNINATTVNAGEFIVTGVDSNGGKTEYNVTGAVANGKSVVLTLSDELKAGDTVTVEMADYKSKSVTYNLTDEVGQKVPGGTAKVVFYSTKNASFNLAWTKDNEITIEGLNSLKDIVYTDVDLDKKLSNNDTTTAFVVTVDNNVVAPTSVKYNGTNWVITLGAALETDQTVRVYYLGTTESFKVSGNSQATQDIYDAINAEIAAYEDGALGDKTAAVAYTTRGNGTTLLAAKILDVASMVTPNNGLFETSAAAGKVAYYSVTFTNSTKSVTKYYKITGTANANKFNVASVEESAVVSAVNTAIAADMQDVVTAFNVPDATAVATDITLKGATGDNGTTIAVTELIDKDNKFATAVGSVGITGSANSTVLIKVDVSNTLGTTVTKFFKVTQDGTGANYTSGELSSANAKAEILDYLNVDFSKTTDDLLTAIGATTKAGNLATYKTNLATAKATKGSALTAAEIIEVVDQTDLNVEATAIGASPSMSVGADQIATITDVNITGTYSGTVSTVVTAIDPTAGITIADVGAESDVVLTLTKGEQTLDITITVTGNGSGGVTTNATSTPFTF